MPSPISLQKSIHGPGGGEAMMLSIENHVLRIGQFQPVAHVRIRWYRPVTYAYYEGSIAIAVRSAKVV